MDISQLRQLVVFQHWSVPRSMRRAIAPFLLLPMLVAGCENPASEPTSPTSSPPPISPETPSPVDDQTPSPSPTASVDPNQSQVISAEGIGPARLGMTLGDLKQALGPTAEFTVQTAFVVDFDAIAVAQNGAVQYYILYLAGQPLIDTDVIQGLLTNNPDYQTAEGVGPETSIQQAETIYGEAILSYNTDNESREYVRFANQPARNLSFATGNGNQQTAGVYASPMGGYNETQDYNPDATIQSVLVVCLDEACAGGANRDS